MRRYDAAPRVPLIAVATVGVLLGVLIAVVAGLLFGSWSETSPGSSVSRTPTAEPTRVAQRRRLHRPRAFAVHRAPAAPHPVFVAMQWPIRLRLRTPRVPAEASSDEPVVAVAAREHPVETCLDATRPACRAVIETALRESALNARASRLASPPAAHSKGPPGAAAPAAAAAGYVPRDGSALAGAEPLRFSSKPEWMRRLDRIGREGLPFVRMPRSDGRELVIGINRKGVLGAFLVESPSRPSASRSAVRGATPRGDSPATTMTAAAQAFVAGPVARAPTLAADAAALD